MICVVQGSWKEKCGLTGWLDFETLMIWNGGCPSFLPLSHAFANEVQVFESKSGPLPASPAKLTHC
jgi:hypothetical protein